MYVFYMFINFYFQGHFEAFQGFKGKLGGVFGGIKRFFFSPEHTSSWINVYMYVCILYFN